MKPCKCDYFLIGNTQSGQRHIFLTASSNGISYGSDQQPQLFLLPCSMETTSNYNSFHDFLCLNSSTPPQIFQLFVQILLCERVLEIPFCVNFCRFIFSFYILIEIVQLNEYQIDPCFLELSQNMAANCLFTFVFFPVLT